MVRLLVFLLMVIYVLGAIGIPGIGITAEQIESFGLISDLALGFIAFAMGNEFRLAQLKKIGKQATVIGVVQALFTTVIAPRTNGPMRTPEIRYAVTAGSFTFFASLDRRRPASSAMERLKKILAV